MLLEGKTDRIVKNIEEQIKEAVKEAEAHAEEDKKKKEEVEIRNNADSMIYNTEKSLKEIGDKISPEEKAKIETELENLRKALAGTDLEAIKLANENLTQEFYKLSEKLYSQVNQNGAEANGENTENAEAAQNSGDNVYDAEYNVQEEETPKDDKK
mgnify:CR=1 FL=1